MSAPAIVADEEMIPVIGDLFKLVPHHILGVGGLGIVYEASMHGSDGFSKRVAVKMLRRKWTEDTRFVELLVSEAKLVSSLVHQNIAQIHFLGSLPDRRHYLVMEFVHGISLKALLERLCCAEKLIPERLAVYIASQVAGALGYAHDHLDPEGNPQHIVHRDVCPNNILISKDGFVKLIDFGIAKARTMTIIGDHWQMGKAPYKSPEQAMRKPLDHRTDIYALGAVLFEMLTGRPLVSRGEGMPFETRFNQTVLRSFGGSRVNDALLAILFRVMADQVHHRFESASALARALGECIYRDSFGPTMHTLEDYLREICPELYELEHRAKPTPRMFEATLTEAAD